MVKAIIGLLVAFSVGFICRALGIPSPAPPMVMGAVLVMAMTVGYILMDRALGHATRPHRHAADADRSASTLASKPLGDPPHHPSDDP